jgi:hypothetical protein
VKVLKIGHDKAGSDRRIKLPEVMAAFFTEAAKDKSPQAPCSPAAAGRLGTRMRGRGPSRP